MIKHQVLMNKFMKEQSPYCLLSLHIKLMLYFLLVWVAPKCLVSSLTMWKWSHLQCITGMGAKDFFRSKERKNTQPLLLSPDYDIDPELIHHVKSGPKRKLTLKQEMLMFLMKLRLDVMVEDSACWFHMSPGKIFEIFITWVKLMSKQLGVLVIWSSNIFQIRMWLLTVQKCL